MKKNLIFALGLSLVTGFTACSSEIEDGTTDHQTVGRCLMKK